MDHLQRMHRAIFQDVYEWAGELRTVDISRGQNRFASLRQIVPYARNLFAALAQERWLQGLDAALLAARLAQYLSEINTLHPFREGNGRVQRVFAAQLAVQAGHALSYAGLTQEDMYPVMVAAFSGDEHPLARLLEARLAVLPYFSWHCR